MNVSDASASLGELLERMEQAHRGEAAEQVRQTDDTAASDGPDAGAESTTGEAVDAISPRLESRLLETARGALEGDFGSVDEVRSEVVDAIIDERYADRLSDGEADRIAETLRATLTADPNFQREVDNMLVLAAGMLADE